MAGRIPQSFIDDLLTRTDIVEVIDPRVQLKKAGREYTACCPFHNEKTPSFTVSQAKQFYHCFGCGAHGSAIGFLMEYEHLNFPEAVEELARMNGIEVPREAGPAPDPKARERQNTRYDLMAQTDRYYRQQLRHHPQAPRAVDYLKQRGLSGEIAAAFGVGFAPPGWDNLLKALGSDENKIKQLTSCGMLIEKDEDGHYDRFRDRIMFPIRDQRGRTIAFGGRILGDDKPKYLNSPETPLFHKGRELYGLFEMRQALRKIDRVMVVEGYMDVVALAQFDIRYAVATLGTATTPDHLNRLFRISPEVVFCFDGDRAGRDAAWRALDNALPILKEGQELRFLFLPEGEDPDTLVRKEGKAGFEARLDKARPLSRYFFEQLSSQVDAGSPEGRARIAKMAQPYLAKLPKSLFKQMMVNELAQLTQLESSTIEDNLKLEPKPQAAEAAPTRSSQTSRRKLPQNRSAVPTPIRRGVTALLHEPGLALLVELDNFPQNSKIPGLSFFCEIVRMIHDHPGTEIASLYAMLEGSPYHGHLRQLSGQEKLIDGKLLETEFVGILDSIQRLSSSQSMDERMDALFAKPPSQLTDTEKEEVRHYFANHPQS